MNIAVSARRDVWYTAGTYLIHGIHLNTTRPRVTVNICITVNAVRGESRPFAVPRTTLEIIVKGTSYIIVSRKKYVLLFAPPFFV